MPRDSFRRKVKRAVRKGETPTPTPPRTRSGVVRPPATVETPTDPAVRATSLVILAGLQPIYEYQVEVEVNGASPSYQCIMSVAIPHVLPATTTGTTQAPQGATTHTWASTSSFDSKAGARANVCAVALDPGNLVVLLDSYQKEKAVFKSAVAAKCWVFDRRCLAEGINVEFTMITSDDGIINGRLVLSNSIGNNRLYEGYSSGSHANAYSYKLNIVNNIFKHGLWETISKQKRKYRRDEATRAAQLAQTAAAHGTPIEEMANEEGQAHSKVPTPEGETIGERQQEGKIEDGCEGAEEDHGHAAQDGASTSSPVAAGDVILSSQGGEDGEGNGKGKEKDVEEA